MKNLSRDAHLPSYVAVPAVSLLFLLLIPPFFLSMGLAAAKLFREFSWPFFWGSVLSASLLLLFLRFAKHIERSSDTVFLSLACAVSLLVKSAIVFMLGDSYPQTQDYGLMHRFVDIFVSQGIDSPELASFYDWRAFVNRSFPLFWPLRYLFGENDAMAVQVANVILETGSLILVYTLLAEIVEERIRRLVVCLLLLFPVHNWEVLNYTHDIPGAFLFLCCLLTVKTIAQRPEWNRILVFGILLGLLLFLLRLQRGLHQFTLLASLILLLFLVLQREKTSRMPGHLVRLFSGLIFLPFLVYFVPSHSFDQFKQNHQARSLKGGMESFMARGMSMETLGEYNGLYEKIDIATPPELKNEVQRSIILSQVRYNSFKILGLLPIIKEAKFFLVGYASCVEENLMDAGHRRAAYLARACRSLFAPFFLGLALAGCFWLVHEGRLEGRHAWLVVLPVAGCLVLVFLGEASPRYSFFLHFALCIPAAEGIVRLQSQRKADREREDLIAAAEKILTSCFVFLGGYLLLAFLALTAVHLYGGEYIFHDMRHATLEMPVSNVRGHEEDTQPETLKPFEQWLLLPRGTIHPGDTVTGMVALPYFGREDMELSFYFLGPEAGAIPQERFSISILTDNGEEFRSTLAAVGGGKKVNRFSRVWKVDDQEGGGLSLRIRVTYGGESPLSLEKEQLLLRWGYLSLRPLSRQ